MQALTVKERTMLAEKLKAASKFLIHFINVAMIRPELATSSIKAGNDLVEYLENISDVLPTDFEFNVIVKIYNYAKDSGLDKEPGVYWVAWQAELSYNTLAFCTHTHTIDEQRKKRKNAAYEYKFTVRNDGDFIEEDIPNTFENYQVPFLHNAANPMEFKPRGSWLSADISFNKGTY
jgi:hypothetical protein